MKQRDPNYKYTEENIPTFVYLRHYLVRKTDIVISVNAYMKIAH